LGKWPARDEKQIRATIDFEKKYAFTPSYAPQDDTPIHIENKTDNSLDYL